MPHIPILGNLSPLIPAGSDVDATLAFYTQKLGFTLDWNHQVEGRAFVFQVSLYGFELILNQIEDWTKDRAGNGRVFIGLEGNQVARLREWAASCQTSPGLARRAGTERRKRPQIE